MLQKDDFQLPILTTDRLILRGLDSTDAEALVRLRSDDEVNTYLDRPSTTTYEAVEVFIKTIQESVKRETSYYWAIISKNDSDLIGTVCYWNINVAEAKAELGYELLPMYHRKGMMTEALRSVISYGFETLKWQSITAFSRHDNIASRFLLEKVGFQEDENYKLQEREDLTGYSVYILTKEKPEGF